MHNKTHLLNSALINEVQKINSMTYCPVWAETDQFNIWRKELTKKITKEKQQKVQH